MARALLNGWTVALISETNSRPPLDTMLAGLDLDGDGISRTLLPGISGTTRSDENWMRPSYDLWLKSTTPTLKHTHAV